ncbi:MAG: HEPN domain-containing protein [Deltaproteobacteria bacterium]|nr:HEPN domain-containing protein [Deltaproteobacteria bacterium]
MTDVLKELARYRMDQAREAARAARALIEGSLFRDSVNRSYYAMFYAVLALLATRALGTSKHSAAISLFDREFVKDGLVSRELSRWLHTALDKRLKADYAEEPVLVTAEEAERLADEAGRFIAAVADYLSGIGL